MKSLVKFFSVLFFCLSMSVNAVPFYSLESTGIRILTDSTLYVSKVTDNMDVTKENLGLVVKNDIVWRSNGDGIGGALFNTTSSIIGPVTNVIWQATAGDRGDVWSNQFNPDGSGVGLRQFLSGPLWDAIGQGDHAVLNNFYDALGNLKYSFIITDSPYSSVPVSIGGIIPLMLIGLMGMFTFHRRLSDPGGQKLAIT